MQTSKWQENGSEEGEKKEAPFVVSCEKMDSWKLLGAHHI